jgi:hypothetical protein
MNTSMSRGLIRFFAAPVAAAGIIGGATLGLAAVANAPANNDVLSHTPLTRTVENPWPPRNRVAASPSASLLGVLGSKMLGER